MGKIFFIVCKRCGSRFEEELDQWPSPDITADTAHESSDSIAGVLVCPNCGKEIDYSISEDFNGNVICVPSELKIINK